MSKPRSCSTLAKRSVAPFPPMITGTICDSKRRTFRPASQRRCRNRPALFSSLLPRSGSEPTMATAARAAARQGGGRAVE